MADLQDLLARVEAAEGEDWQVRDCVLEVAEALLPRGGDASAAFARRRELIASIEAGSRLDAALGLVERVLPGWWCSVADYEAPVTGDKIARCYLWRPARQDLGLYGDGRGRPTAVLAAMLRALIADLDPKAHRNTGDR